MSYATRRALAISSWFESLLPMRGSLTGANQIQSSLPAAAGAIMAKRHSTDLRVRVVALVEAGESRREAARLLDLARLYERNGWFLLMRRR